MANTNPSNNTLRNKLLPDVSTWKALAGLAFPTSAWDEHAPVAYYGMQTRAFCIDLVHVNSLYQDVADRSRDWQRFATPQGPFILTKRAWNPSTLDMAASLVGCRFVCTCHAIVVTGVTQPIKRNGLVPSNIHHVVDGDFTPVGCILEDLGDTTLHSWLASGAAGAKDAGLQLVCVVRDVLRGLRAVHESGFVYGDSLKSSKIMITHSGAAKLLQPSSGISSAAVPVHDDMRALGRLLLQWVGVVPDAADALGPLIRALTGDGEPPSAADALKLVPADDVAAFSRQAGALLARSTTCLDEFDQVKVATADNADVQLSLTCFDLATAMSRLMSAQRARSLACARELADLVTRFHSHDTRLPVKESVLYKLYLAAVDVLLDLNTTADNIAASNLIETLCTMTTDLMPLTARLVRCLRQQRRHAEVEALLAKPLNVLPPASAAYAAFVNEKMAYLVTCCTKKEVEEFLPSLDFTQLHVSYALTTKRNRAKALIHLGDRSHLMDAVELLEDTIAVLRETHGGNAVVTNQELYRKAEAFRIYGTGNNLTAAARIYDVVLKALVDKGLDASHPSIAAAMRGLAMTISHTDVENAREAALNRCDEVMIIYRETHGAHHPLVLAALRDKVDLLQQMGTVKHLHDAKKICNKVIVALRTSWNTCDTPIATALVDKALVLERLGGQDDLHSALELLCQASSIYTTLHQKKSLLGALQHRARLVHRIDRHSTVPLELYDEVVRMQRAIYGRKHDCVASTLNDKADVLQDMGGEDNLCAAIELYKEVIAMKTATLGEAHPSVASTNANMACALQALGGTENLQEAIRIYDRVLSVHRLRVGDFNHLVALTKENKATALLRLGDRDSLLKCIELCDEIAMTQRPKLGEDHDIILAALNHKACALIRLGDPDPLKAAIIISDQVLKRLKMRYAPGHSALVPTLTNKIAALRKMGGRANLISASKVYDDVISIHEEEAKSLRAHNNGPRKPLPPVLATTLRHKASLLVELKDRKSLVAAVNIYDRLLVDFRDVDELSPGKAELLAAKDAVLEAMRC